MQSAKVANALTIDVEDYFQVSAFAPHIPRSEWPTRECRVERNIDRILAMLDEHGTKATFFTLGWIAERYPELIRRIVAEGHEMASHGYGHERASEQTAAAFFATSRAWLCWAISSTIWAARSAVSARCTMTPFCVSMPVN